MERYELVEGTTAKFWQWEVRGSDLVVQYGRIGSAGKEQVKSLPDEDEARKAAAKLMREKTGKGYGLVGATVEKASINKDPVDAELVALAKKVAAKREYASDSIKYLKSQVTARRAMPLLWTMAANGLLPAKALTAQLPTLAEDVEAFHAITGSDEDFSTRKQREGLRAGITYIALGAESIDPAWDPLLIPISNYGLVLKRLPQDRRDAVILATLKDEMPRKLDLLALASDSALDQGVEMLVARRKRFTNDQDGDDIESGFTAMGSRGSAALVRHLAGKNDAGAHLIINYSRLDDATVSDLTGGAPPLPTAGVEAVMLRFAQSAPASWEEAKTTKGKKAIHVSNLITFCWLDASAKLDELANDAQKTFEDATTDGVVLTDDNQVAAVYVGEIATMHKMFWGLGEDGAPVCLVAGFRYPSED